MSKYSSLFTETPQTSPIPEEKHLQARNNAGGYSYVLDKWKRLERFLILGSDTNTYYQKAAKLTKENASVVIECWEHDPIKTAKIISDISINGRAPKNSPAIFAVALGCLSKDVNARQAAHNTINVVCRTSTHLFEFVDTYDKLGGKGFGRGMKRAVSSWYTNKSDDQLAYQLIKYRQREGYTHERLIRRARPKHNILTPARVAMYEWLRGRNYDPMSLPDQLLAHINAMVALDNPHDERILQTFVREYKLPWEALPTWANTKPEIWREMLLNMPVGALLRNLANMTRVGVFDDGGLAVNIACTRLTNEKVLKYSRLHPFNILFGAKTYTSGTGFRGNNQWTPVDAITRALAEGFNTSFKFVEPTNKRICIALDISPSMDSSKLFQSNISAREASAAMALATINAEPSENILSVAFSSMHAHNMRGGKWGGALMNISDKLHKGVGWSEAIYALHGLPYVGTDCSLPIIGALEEHAEFDAFVVYTDNETFAGRIHPSEALRKYRDRMGIDAKLVVVGMTSTGFTIADPNDPGMLDVVGFDSNAPAVISSFIRGPQALLENHISGINDETEDEDKEDQS